MSYFKRALIVLAALILTVSACGDDNGIPGGEGQAITVTAIDYEFLDLPPQVEVGTEIILQNSSDEEAHEFVAIRLPDAEDRAVSDLVRLEPDELALLFDGLETVIVAPPNGIGFPVEGVGELTEPGRYAIICAVPSGADPNEYIEAVAEASGQIRLADTTGGAPHFVHGMYADLEVVEG